LIPTTSQSSKECRN